MEVVPETLAPNAPTINEPALALWWEIPRLLKILGGPVYSPLVGFFGVGSQGGCSTQCTFGMPLTNPTPPQHRKGNSSPTAVERNVFLFSYSALTLSFY